MYICNTKTKQLKSMKTDVIFIRESIESVRARSAWDRGVKMFALDILDKYNEACYFYEQEGEEYPDFCLSSVLNGADSSSVTIIRG